MRRLRNPTRLPAVVAIFLRRLRAHVHRLEPWFSLVKIRPHWRERAVIIITRVASCHSAPKMLCESATSTVDESSEGSNPPIDPADAAATGRLDRREEVKTPQFLVVVLACACSPSKRVLRPSDGVDGLFCNKTPSWSSSSSGARPPRRRGCGGEHVEKAAGVLGRSLRRVGVPPAMRRGCKGATGRLH